MNIDARCLRGKPLQPYLLEEVTQVSQLFQADTATKGRGSDIEDLIRIKALPYVNVFVADAAKRTYLNALCSGKSSRLRGCDYWTRCTIVGSLEEARGDTRAK